jgi:hypothetical protein
LASKIDKDGDIFWTYGEKYEFSALDLTVLGRMFYKLNLWRAKIRMRLDGLKKIEFAQSS